jgi:monofunctional glycosyltransferase
MREIFKTTKRIFFCLLLVIFLYQLWIFANVIWWKWNPPENTSFMSIRLQELQQKNADAKLRYEWVNYEKISPHLKRAVIAAEDGKFLVHHGFDWEGIEKAMKKNQRRGKRAAGGSTITQQLAKNLFLSPSKSYSRKLQEVIITVMIETCWDKRRILEVYLNVVEWGEGTFGAQVAAKRHYQVSAANLSAVQAAHMVVMLPNPRRFERKLPTYSRRYADHVLRRMPMTKIP